MGRRMVHCVPVLSPVYGCMVFTVSLWVTQDVSGDGQPNQDQDGTLLGRLASMPMSRAEQRIIAYLLSIPEAERGFATASQVAMYSDTSRSTIDRLARRLGFAGFGPLRRSLARERGLTFLPGGEERALDPAILFTDEPEAIATKILGSVSSRTVAFGQMLLVDDRLRRVVAILDRARRCAGRGRTRRWLRWTCTIDSCVLGLASSTPRTRTPTRLRVASRPRRRRRPRVLLGAHRPGPASGRHREERGPTPLPSPATRCRHRTHRRRLHLHAAGSGPVRQRRRPHASPADDVSDVLFHCLALADPTRLGRAQSIDEILNTVKVLPGATSARKTRTRQRRMTVRTRPPRSSAWRSSPAIRLDVLLQIKAAGSGHPAAACHAPTSWRCSLDTPPTSLSSAHLQESVTT
jgi:hypothetical protein